MSLTLAMDLKHEGCMLQNRPYQVLSANYTLQDDAVPKGQQQKFRRDQTIP